MIQQKHLIGESEAEIYKEYCQIKWEVWGDNIRRKSKQLFMVLLMH